MSAQSGIKVPDELKTAFSSAQSEGSETRALVFIIDGESYKVHETVKTKGSFKDDVTQLAGTLPTPKTPASFAYRLDSKDLGKWEWMMITFVPDDAGVRAKMLQASSKPGLMKALGANNFKHDWSATSINDLTPGALSAHLNHLASPPPLSAAEAALAEVREAEAEEARRTALDPEAEARRRKAIAGLGGKFKWNDGVADALDKVGERSDDGWIVTLEIPSNDAGAVSLLRSEACPPSKLASMLPEKSPCYTFYSYPTPPPPPSATPAPKPSQPMAEPRDVFRGTVGGARPVQASWAPASADSAKEGESAPEASKAESNVDEEAKDATVESPVEKPSDEGDEASSVKNLSISPIETSASPQKGKGRILFLYTCPSSSPIKFRMVYSSGVRGMQQDAADKAGIEISGKIETSDLSDLTESYLKENLAPSKPTHSSSLPTPKKTAMAGATPTPFGGAFGRPRPPTVKTGSASSASQIPLPSSEVSTPAGDSEDGGDNIRKAFDAFGPRVGAGGGGGGFARPKPAGRR
ncbi:hypothetical protein BD324DRAFT_247631 [Kockovaella imperatae]|uniref:ADF-H domain-containing protein n=1 Tax=Kockovaella imperatae TaxID=4999 RepID=A0A1Y1UR85_9TREE|nr:hypothetical protein BD324DRAFT_247631 [Kockovaella imperatae]ORX39984.1 hypothetical protein BD324DRAFT_247631 [Kockovaella imperatae]